MLSWCCAGYQVWNPVKYRPQGWADTALVGSNMGTEGPSRPPCFSSIDQRGGSERGQEVTVPAGCWCVWEKERGPILGSAVIHRQYLRSTFGPLWIEGMRWNKSRNRRFMVTYEGLIAASTKIISILADLNNTSSISSYLLQKSDSSSQGNCISGGLSPVELIPFIITVTNETNEGLLNWASGQ